MQHGWTLLQLCRTRSWRRISMSLVLAIDRTTTVRVHRLPNKWLWRMKLSCCTLPERPRTEDEPWCFNFLAKLWWGLGIFLQLLSYLQGLCSQGVQGVQLQSKGPLLLMLPRIKMMYGRRFSVVDFCSQPCSETSAAWPGVTHPSSWLLRAVAICAIQNGGDLSRRGRSTPLPVVSARDLWQAMVGVVGG